MDGKQFAALMLIVGGVVTLVYSGFHYRQATRSFESDTVQVANEEEFLGLPVWAGIGALVIGGLVLSLPKRT